MKRLLITLTVALATLTMSAQDQFLNKYSAMGDVSTYYTNGGNYDAFPEEFRAMLSRDRLNGKVKSVKLLYSDKLKAAKKLQNVAKDAKKNGYKEFYSDKKGCMLQHQSDPHNFIFVFSENGATGVMSIRATDEALKEMEEKQGKGK